MTALIVDGISGAGKSLLLSRVQRLNFELAPNYTKLFISEHMTERFFEGVEPSQKHVHEHLTNILNIIMQLQKIQTAGPFASHNKMVTVIIERFFLTFLSRGLMSRTYFDEQSELITAARLRHVLILIPDDLIEQRLHLSLSHRVKAWADFINSLGGIRPATDMFKSQQSRMVEANQYLPDSIQRVIFRVSQLSELEDEETIKGLIWPHQ